MNVVEYSKDIQVILEKYTGIVVNAIRELMEMNLMTEKRFIPIFDGTDKRVVGGKDNGQVISFMRMFELLNELYEENEQLREWMKDLKHEYDSLHDICAKLDKKVKCIQEEANDYCEELMGKDEFIRLYKRQRDEVIEENNQLKKEKRKLQKELICQAFSNRSKKNE